MTTVSALIESLFRAQDAETEACDLAARLLAEGTSLGELGRVLNRSRQTATDRFSVVPGPRELGRAIARAELYHGTKLHGVRVTAWHCAVLFYDSQCWRVLRHAQSEEAAAALAMWLGDWTEFRYVAKPRDLDGFESWQYPTSRTETGR